MFLTSLFVLAALAAPVPAEPPPAVSLTAALASQVGRWKGSLDYRDYQADKWFGLPVSVVISDGGDGVTQLRVADFDDGPRVGIVRITTVTMQKGLDEYSVGFRKGREPELTRSTLTLARAADGAHWTIVSSAEGSDDDRPARIRVTTIRDGDNMTTLKEVDFSDDTGEKWLQRNRSTLKRLGG